jgi:IS1 family transposase
MNRLSTEQRTRVIAALIEGNSIRATVRMTGVAKNTIVKLLADIGTACQAYHDEHVRGLKPVSIQCDEIWAFVGAKQKNVSTGKQVEGWGDAWTWTCLDRDSKLIISYHLGLRTPDDAREFMQDIAGRINNHTQLSTDGLGCYPDAVREAFGDMVDYAQIIKVYREQHPDHARYSPASCVGCQKKWIQGAVFSEMVSTSHVERNNLTMRMSMRRFTRLTNAFSKKLQNLQHALALHFMHYNYCRKHQTLKQTPAMAANLADHQWTIQELIGLLELARSN